MSRSRRKRAQRSRKRCDLNADLLESSDDEERSRIVLTPESNWRELQFQAYLRSRMRHGRHKKTVQVIDDRHRPVSLAERIVRFKLTHTQEDITQMEPAVSLGERQESSQLQDLLQQYIQQRQTEAALSAEFLSEINVVKTSLRDDELLLNLSANRGRQSQSISLGDSATDFNCKMRYRIANNCVDESDGRKMSIGTGDEGVHLLSIDNDNSEDTPVENRAVENVTNAGVVKENNNSSVLDNAHGKGYNCKEMLKDVATERRDSRTQPPIEPKDKELLDLGENESRLKSLSDEPYHTEDMYLRYGNTHENIAETRDKQLLDECKKVHVNGKAKEDEIILCELSMTNRQAGEETAVVNQGVVEKTSLDVTNRDERMEGSVSETSSENGGQISEWRDETLPDSLKNDSPHSGKYEMYSTRHEKQESDFEKQVCKHAAQCVDSVDVKCSAENCSWREEELHNTSYTEGTPLFEEKMMESQGNTRNKSEINEIQSDKSVYTTSHSDQVEIRSNTFIISTNDEKTYIDCQENKLDSEPPHQTESIEILKTVQNRIEFMPPGNLRIDGAIELCATPVNIYEGTSDQKESNLDLSREHCDDIENARETDCSPNQLVFGVTDSKRRLGNGDNMVSHSLLERKESRDGMNSDKNDMSDNYRERHVDELYSSTSPTVMLPQFQGESRRHVYQNSTSLISKHSYTNFKGRERYHNNAPNDVRFDNNFQNEMSLSNSCVHLPLIDTGRTINRHDYSKGENRAITLPRVVPAVCAPMKCCRTDVVQKGQRGTFNYLPISCYHSNNSVNNSLPFSSQPFTNGTSRYASKQRSKSTNERETRIKDLYRKLKELDVFQEDRLEIPTSHICSRFVNMHVEWGFMAIPCHDRKTKYGKTKVRSPLTVTQAHQSPFYDQPVFKDSTHSPSRKRCDFIYLRDVSFCRFVHSSLSENNARNYLSPLLEKRQEPVGPFEKAKWQGKKRATKGGKYLARNTKDNSDNSNLTQVKPRKNRQYRREPD